MPIPRIFALTALAVTFLQTQSILDTLGLVFTICNCSNTRERPLRLFLEMRTCQMSGKMEGLDTYGHNSFAQSDRKRRHPYSWGIAFIGRSLSRGADRPPKDTRERIGDGI